MADTDELSFLKGDIFFVHNDMGDGWLWATKHRTGEQGMIFRELVEDLDPSIDPNTVFGWFHPNCTKNEAVDMLVKNGPGIHIFFYHFAHDDDSNKFLTCKFIIAFFIHRKLFSQAK